MSGVGVGMEVGVGGRELRGEGGLAGKAGELIAGEKHRIHREAGEGRGQESLNRQLRKRSG